MNHYCPWPILIKIYILELVYQPCRLRHTLIKIYILELVYQPCRLRHTLLEIYILEFVYLTNDGHLPFHKIRYTLVANNIFLSNPRYCQYTTIVNNDTCRPEQPNLGTSINHSTYIKYFTPIHCEKYFTTSYTDNYFTNCK